MVLKLERFFYPSDRSFGLISPIRLEYLSLIFSLGVDVTGKSYLVSERGFGEKLSKM